MFEINSKDTRAMSMMFFWCLYCQRWTYIMSFSSVSNFWIWALFVEVDAKRRLVSNLIHFWLSQLEILFGDWWDRYISGIFLKMLKFRAFWRFGFFSISNKRRKEEIIFELKLRNFIFISSDVIGHSL